MKILLILLIFVFAIKAKNDVQIQIVEPPKTPQVSQFLMEDDLLGGTRWVHIPLIAILISGAVSVVFFAFGFVLFYYCLQIRVENKRQNRDTTNLA